MNVNRANVRPGKASVNDGVSLVHRLLNPFGFAAGQLAVFQGASVVPLAVHQLHRPGVRADRDSPGLAVADIALFIR